MNRHRIHEMGKQYADHWGIDTEEDIDNCIKKNFETYPARNSLLLARIVKLLEEQLEHLKHISRPERMRQADEVKKKEDERLVATGPLLDKCMCRLFKLAPPENKRVRSLHTSLHTMMWEYMHHNEFPFFLALKRFSNCSPKQWIKVSPIHLTRAFKTNLNVLLNKDQK